MPITSATLGDVPLLALNDVGWTFTTGVQPHQRVFLVDRADAPRLLATRGDVQGVTLDVRAPADAGGSWSVRRLSVLRTTPADHPDRVGILVADRRWRWLYRWLLRRYNVLRRTGNRTLVTEDRVLAALQFATPDLKYAALSLRPPDFKRPWELRDVVRDVFTVLLETGEAPSVDESLFENAVEIQGFELDHPGPEAAQLLLNLFPSATCRVDDFGNVQILNFADGSELDLVRSLGAPFWGNPLAERVSMATERPSKVHVRFTCEDELRFDYVESGTGTREVDGRWMRNVMPLPNTLTVGGTRLAAGTWVEITDELLTAMRTEFPPISQLGNVISGIQKFDLATLRLIWCNGQYNRYYDAFAGADPVWANFLDALREHYRQTFQVNQRWADRIVGYYPKRVALLDPVNNVWAKPGVWANYALIPSYRRVGRTGGDKTELAYNRTPFPTPSAAPSVDLTTIADQQANAKLKVLDDQLGIFQIAYFPNRGGETIGFTPSNIEGFDPLANTTFSLPSAAVDQPLKVLSHCRLATEHAVSIVLTCVTGAPNDLTQTWDEVVTFEEAKESLPAAVQRQLPDALGPEMDVRIGPGIQTARFAWMDGAEGEQITAALLGRGSRTAYAANLFVNDVYVREVAVAKAAQVYSGMVDHVQGEVVVAAVPSALPTGRASSVEHGIRPDGVAFTKVTLPPPRRGLDFWALVPEFARRLIRGILPRQ